MTIMSKTQEKLWHNVMYENMAAWHVDSEFTGDGECLFLYGAADPMYLMICDGQLSGGNRIGAADLCNFVEQFSHTFETYADVWEYLGNLPVGAGLREMLNA